MKQIKTVSPLAHNCGERGGERSGDPEIEAAIKTAKRLYGNDLRGFYPVFDAVIRKQIQKTSDKQAPPTHVDG